MTTEAELTAAVEAAFAKTSKGLEPWPDPHDGRDIAVDEYSRVTNPARFRLLGARADAWTQALVSCGVATVADQGSTDWAEPPRQLISRATTLVSEVDGALALSIGRSLVEDIPDAGVLLGVGAPARLIMWLPDCGCDACDNGSAWELDRVDEHIAAVVLGRYRRLARRNKSITVTGPGGWSASGSFRRGEVENVLADSSGWDELSGESWLAQHGGTEDEIANTSQESGAQTGPPGGQ